MAYKQTILPVTNNRGEKFTLQFDDTDSTKCIFIPEQDKSQDTVEAEIDSLYEAVHICSTRENDKFLSCVIKQVDNDAELTLLGHVNVPGMAPLELGRYVVKYY